MISSMTRNEGAPDASARALLITPLLAFGCMALDERELAVKPESIALNSFEDMTTQPLDPRFDAWVYSTYSSDLYTIDNRVVTPGFNSNWCSRLSWSITEPPNGTPEFPGVVLRSQIRNKIDLRSYSRFVFTHRYEDPGGCQPLGELRVNIWCSSLDTGFEKKTLVALDWQTSVFDLSSFSEIWYQAKGIKLEDCLAVADEIQFVAQKNLGDGECNAGMLFLDDLSIR
jgi:hypothetical protein